MRRPGCGPPRGAIADVNALLAGVTLTPAANFNGSFIDRHQRQRRGGAGDHRQQGVHRDRGERCADGDQPVDGRDLHRRHPLNLIDIVVSDVDSANVTATLTLSNPAAGSLSTATSGAVTSTYNAGNRGVDGLGGDRRRQYAAGRGDVHAGGELQRQLHRSPPASATAWRRRSPAARRSPASR